MFYEMSALQLTKWFSFELLLESWVGRNACCSSCERLFQASRLVTV